MANFMNRTKEGVTRQSSMHCVCPIIKEALHRLSRLRPLSGCIFTHSDFGGARNSQAGFLTRSHHGDRQSSTCQPKYSSRTVPHSLDQSNGWSTGGQRLT